MLPVLITIDTEYSSGYYASGDGTNAAWNYGRTIACEDSEGIGSGIHYQMDVFERHGLRAVFFVDPMPALVWGPGVVEAVVKPIIERGHEVQLHCHTEWLAFADGRRSPVDGRTGGNIKDFTEDDQFRILEWACERLVSAGAPQPSAFRAGNYGANDDTLRALARLGIAWDSSFAPALQQAACDIGLPFGRCEPVERFGVKELPIAALSAGKDKARHGQLTALSLGEMRAAIRHAAKTGWPVLVLVSHSFELFSRQAGRGNPVLRRRFEAFCEWLGACDIAASATFADLPTDLAGAAPLLPHNPVRTALRMAEQALANRY